MPSSTHNIRIVTHLLSTDDTWLQQDARDRLIQDANAKGFGSRQVITIESAKDWQKALQLTENLGLFSEKQIIDIRNPSAKFDKATQGLLISYAQSANPDCFIIISTGKLTAAQKKAKWFKTLENLISIRIIWPLKPHEFNQWIKNRLQQHNLKAEQQAIQLLIELTEGNLLATNQAIEKLNLLYSNITLSLDHIKSVMHDSAQFNVFDLTNYALAGNINRVRRIMNHLRGEGGEPTLILWALSRELRELYQLVFQHSRGVSTQQLLAKQWASRKPLLQQALKRLTLKKLSTLLQLAQQTDFIIKGAAKGNYWDNLVLIATSLATSQTLLEQAS